MNKRANLYFAALLGAMSPLCTVSALAAQSNSTIATATQQQNSCTGTVKDATGEPIIGATIRIEGKTGGTVTDLDGNFTLNNIEKGAKLTITYVGYKSQTLTWSGSPLNITLQDDANMLEETVVIGYGTVKKATWQVLWQFWTARISRTSLLHVLRMPSTDVCLVCR